MKTKEELNTLKKEVETLNAKLAELTEEELAEVSGGLVQPIKKNFEIEIEDKLSKLKPVSLFTAIQNDQSGKR